MYSYTYKIPDFLLYLNDPLITNEGIDKIKLEELID